MAPEDLPGADELRRLAEWNQTIGGWRCLLGHEPRGCFVAELEGKIIGTVTTTSYGKSLAWIGMMLVHPAHRGKGWASRLMLQALDYLRSEGVECIKLDATPAGQPVYEKFGFKAESTLTRWRRGGSQSEPLSLIRAPEIREPSPSDRRAMAKLDAEAFGVDRAALLQCFGAGSRCFAWLEGETIGGWGMLRSGAHSQYLAPLVARTAKIANSLAKALLASADSPVVWDIPDANAAAVATARGLGFTPVRPLTRMRLGPPSLTENTAITFGIADPSIG